MCASPKFTVVVDFNGNDFAVDVVADYYVVSEYNGLNFYKKNSVTEMTASFHNWVYVINTM